MRGKAIARATCFLFVCLCLLSSNRLRAQLTPGTTNSGAPLLRGFTPSSAAQGASVTLTFTGINFRAPASLQISPSTGLRVSAISVSNANQIQATLQIDPSAPLGPRQLILMVADHSLISSAPFNITAAQQNCPPGMAAVACQSAPSGSTNLSALRGYAPTQGAQGTTVTLTFGGANFAGPAFLRFKPAAGLAVQGVQVSSANQIQAQVLVAADAALGPRIVSLVVAGHLLEVSPAFIVAPGKSPCAPGVFAAAGLPCPAGAGSLSILRITPNQIAAGSQNVDLKIEGTGFAPGAQATFATESGAIANVFPQGISRFVNSTEIHVIVNVSAAAIPGGRNITLTNSSRASGLGRGMLNVLPAAPAKGGLPPKVKIVPIAFQHFPEGTINLAGPKWGTVYDGADGAAENYGIPPLNDETVFEWAEQNPGTADYFELRIYNHDGTKLLGTKRIDGSTVTVNGSPVNNVPTYYRAEPGFLNLVLSAAEFGQLPPLTFRQSPQPKQPSGSPHLVPIQTAPQGTGPQLAAGDLQWEVAGFRIYNTNGTARAGQGLQSVSLRAGTGAGIKPGSNAGSGGQTDLEVEKSDRWALAATQAPTGLKDCSLAAPCGKGLQLFNLDAPAGDLLTHYVGDRMILSGSFDLSRSPYNASPTAVQQPCSGQCFQNANPVQQFQFGNLFVDWGDGSVQPLSAPPSDPNTSQWNSNVTLTLPSCDPSKMNSTPKQPCYSMIHKYNYAGTFNVRVFQLSNQDVQQVNASLVAASADGPSVNPYLAVATLQHLSMKGGAGSSAGTNPVQAAVNSLQSGGPSPTDVAGRAYMIYCNQLIVTPVEDPLSNGPLYVRSINAPDFGSHDLSGQGLMKAKLGGVGNPLSLGGRGNQERDLRPALPSARGSESAAQGRPLRPHGPRQAGAAPVAVCSACDDSMIGQTTLYYVGRGRAQIIWHVDGGTWPSQSSGEPVDVPASTPRANLTRQQAAHEAAHPDPDKVPPTALTGIYSKRLPLMTTPSADHSVWVEAEVLPSLPPPNLSSTLLGSLNAILAVNSGGTSARAGGGSAKQNVASAAQTAQAALSMLTPPAGSGLPPLKVGFLSPSNHVSPGWAPVQYVNSSLSKIAASAPFSQQPGSYVKSDGSAYEVTNADSKQPCKFLFPVQDGGSFEVTGLQNHVTESGGKWNGTGTLLINLASENGYEQYPGVPIKIENWQVSSDGAVQSGSFDVSPQLKLAGDTPALTGAIDRLQGAAGQAVTATLSVQLADNNVHFADNSVPKWSGVAKTLTSAGDWYATGLTLPESILGYTNFTIQSNDVRLDLSLDDGDAPGGLCSGGSGKQWLGVRFGSATIVPYTMGLVGSSAMAQTKQNWAIDQYSVCGSLHAGQFTAQVDAGTVSFQSIDFTAQNGTFQAIYHGMDVHVPWLNVDMTGDPQLLSGGGKLSSMTFPLNGTAQPLRYPNVTLKTSNLQFTTIHGGPWAAQADTEWDLSAENRPFAQIKTNMFFGMDGRAYFKDANPSEDVTLGGTSSLGMTPIELVSAHLSAHPTGTDLLDFAFQTKLHLSEVMAATNVQVNYAMQEPQPGQYASTGPQNAPFMVEIPYPAGQPSSDAKVHPTYNGGGGGGGGGGNAEYSGTVDLSELGGPPVTGEFRLGYQGGHDYWLTRVTIGLGDSGVPLIPAPPVMNLFAIRGGIGHNFPINAFSDAGSLNSEQPSMDGSFLFMAGIRVGMPDQFTYTLDGDLTIEASGPQAGARMDFHAWLLTADHSGNGTFQGYFQYAANSFDGRLWGGMDFMGGLASFSLGSSANDAAVDLHFGSGSWHIYAGNKNGQRVQAHFIVANANGYLMLGSDVGLALGGDENFCMCIGDSSVASAYIKGDLDIGVQITPQPHFIGDASASLAAGVCAFSVCIDRGVSAQIHLEALPLEMQGTASLTLPIPFWNPTISFSAHI